MRIESLDARSSEPTFQVILEDRRFQVNQRCLELLQFFSSPRTIPQFDEWFKTTWNSGQVDEKLDQSKRILLAKGLIQPADGSVHIESEHKQLSLRFCRELIHARYLLPITSQLKQLYKPPLCWILILGTITTIAFTLAQQPLDLGKYIGWWSLAGIVYVSLLFHELGHLAACRYFNRTHGGIGFGVFFIYPVFYADVTECWSLNRYQRAVVDIGGVYFQLLFGSLIGLYGLWTDSSVTRSFVSAITICSLINLNPVFRLDGYWLLSDLCGVPSLERLRRNLVKRVSSSGLGQRDANVRRKDLKYPTWLVAVVVVYSVVCILFFGRMALVIYRTLPSVTSIISAQVIALYSATSEPLGSSLVSSFVELLGAAFALGITCRLIYILVHRIHRGLVRPTIRLIQNTHFRRA